MAKGERAARLDKAHDNCYHGKRVTNKCFQADLPRRGKAPQGGPSHKTITNRKERRIATRDLRGDVAELADAPDLGSGA